MTVLPDLHALTATVEQWCSAAVPYLTAAVLLAVVTWTCYAAWRKHRVRAALAGRVTVELVPTSSFDPNENVIGRLGHHLSRISYARGRTPRGGAAARIRYSAADGQMHCYLEGPRESAAVLKMPGLAGIDVVTAGASRSIKPVRFDKIELTKTPEAP